MDIIQRQLSAARRMTEELGGLSFAPPVAAVYNPLDYAWGAYAEYVGRFGGKPGRTLFMGVNPGPWGMAQTGIPFGEVGAVNNWMKIRSPIGRPSAAHAKYPVTGYACRRSEVSGRRLWALFSGRFGRAEAFFEGHFVVNYCPLLFIAEKRLKSGREGAGNLTPDKLGASERVKLYEICDRHLRELVSALAPRAVIGVGGFADTRSRAALAGFSVRFGKLLHPSPASPRSNSGWGAEAERQLLEMGIWR